MIIKIIHVGEQIGTHGIINRLNQIRLGAFMRPLMVKIRLGAYASPHGNDHFT